MCAFLRVGFHGMRGIRPGSPGEAQWDREERTLPVRCVGWKEECGVNKKESQREGDTKGAVFPGFLPPLHPAGVGWDSLVFFTYRCCFKYFHTFNSSNNSEGKEQDMMEEGKRERVRRFL